MHRTTRDAEKCLALCPEQLAVTVARGGAVDVAGAGVPPVGLRRLGRWEGGNVCSIPRSVGDPWRLHSKQAMRLARVSGTEPKSAPACRWERSEVGTL